MADIDQASSPNAAVSQHLIHGFFPFAFARNGTNADPEAALDLWQIKALSLSVRDVSTRLGWTPEDARSLEQPVWTRQEAGKGLALGDFYPHVRQVMSMQPGQEAGPCRLLRLDTTLLSRHRGEDKHGHKRALTIDLRQAAAQRCGRTSLNVVIDGARLFAFSTGIAILDLYWHYEVDGELSPDVLLEGNYFLSHDNHRHADAVAVAADKNAIDSDVLQRIAEALFPSEQASTSTLHLHRRIIYSTVLLDRAVSEKRLRVLTTRLSHRQTSDYEPSADMQEGALWQPFSYLCHASVPEGGASVIVDIDQRSSFVRNFVGASALNTYLPLFVLTLHSHLWLITQTEWIPARHKRAGSLAESRNLDSVYEETVLFRRYFHFPLVSQIGLHNTFYQHWQDALRIPERLKFVEETARDVAELVRSRRLRFIERWSGAGAGLLLAHQLLDFLSTSNLPGLPDWYPDARVWPFENNKQADTLKHYALSATHWDIAIFLGSLAGAVAGYYVVKHIKTRGTLK
jgi:hypothetical protein